MKKRRLANSSNVRQHRYDEGFSFSFRKNCKLDPTYPRLAMFSLRELHQTSPYQSDPPENQIWHTDEAGASLACYRSTLISGTSFFSQWYFPSSGRSTNEILWEIVASCPFLGPSRLRRSLARSRETRFTLPNRRACPQAIQHSKLQPVGTRQCICDESTKEIKQPTQPRRFQFRFIRNITKPKEANARRRERAKICQRFFPLTINLRVTRCIGSCANYQENTRHCSRQQKLWLANSLTARLVIGYLRTLKLLSHEVWAKHF